MWGLDRGRRVLRHLRVAAEYERTRRACHRLLVRPAVDHVHRDNCCTRTSRHVNACVALGGIVVVGAHPHSADDIGTSRAGRRFRADRRDDVW